MPPGNIPMGSLRRESRLGFQLLRVHDLPDAVAVGLRPVRHAHIEGQALHAHLG